MSLPVVLFWVPAPHPERVLKELRQGRRVTSLRTFPMHAGTFIRWEVFAVLAWQTISRWSYKGCLLISWVSFGDMLVPHLPYWMNVWHCCVNGTHPLTRRCLLGHPCPWSVLFIRSPLVRLNGICQSTTRSVNHTPSYHLDCVNCSHAVLTTWRLLCGSISSRITTQSQRHLY